jgi:hypothetical protein
MDNPAVQPIFVLSAARSGSTLLSRALDAHPDVACPMETNLASTLAALEFTANAVASGDHGQASARYSEAFHELSQKIANETLGAYALEAGKSRWADKSLPSLDHAELLAQLFHDARFICLYRHPIDTIASLLEATPYGYGEFGLEMYVRASPTNLVDGFANYWLDKANTMMRLEETPNVQCFRLRYEDMVLSTEESLGRLFDFLELEWDAAHISDENVFGRSLDAGKGDYKIRYTSSFDPASIGRGWHIPVELMSKSTRDRVDDVSQRLGYPPLNRTMAMIEHGSKSGAPGSDAPELITSTKELFEGRIAENLKARHAELSSRREIKVRILDERQSWVVDFRKGSVSCEDRPTTCTAATDKRTLLDVANQAANPATALREGRLQLEFAPEARNLFSTPDKALKQIDALLSLLPAPAKGTAPVR